MVLVCILELKRYSDDVLYVITILWTSLSIIYFSLYEHSVRLLPCFLGWPVSLMDLFIKYNLFCIYEVILQISRLFVKIKVASSLLYVFMQIAQVHRATLRNGKEVVVKVQHDGIKHVILEVLIALSPFLTFALDSRTKM